MNSKVSIALITCALVMLAPAVALATVEPAAQSTKKAAQYVCTMHPEVTSKKPGTCPKCGMALREKSDEAEAGTTVSEKPDGPATSSGMASGVSGASMNIPDTIVYDQDGRRLNFYSDLVKGKTVAINFIFTTCTTICPPLTATMRKVQKDLGDHASRNIQLISVSVDPVTDVPERLKSFAEKFKVGPGWVFVTGSKTDITALLKALGAFARDKNDHTPMMLIGNQSAGYWTRTYGLANAATIIKAITEAAAKK